MLNVIRINNTLSAKWYRVLNLSAPNDGSATFILSIHENSSVAGCQFLVMVSRYGGGAKVNLGLHYMNPTVTAGTTTAVTTQIKYRSAMQSTDVWVQLGGNGTAQSSISVLDKSGAAVNIGFIEETPASDALDFNFAG